MSWIAAVLVAVAVSVDGLWGGLAFGLRRVCIRPAARLVISLITGVCAGLAMMAGHLLARTVPLASAKWVSAALLLAIGVTMLYEAQMERELHSDQPVEPVLPVYYSGDISWWEAGVLGVALAIVASIAAFTIGLAGYASVAIPILMGLAHYVLIGLGNLVGNRRLAHRLTSRIVYLPGGLMVVLGLLRFR